MKHKITTVIMILLAAFITLGGTTSCKSKKRLAREAAEAEYKARVAEATKDLTAILDDETMWTLEEKENRVQTIKDWNLQNAEVDDLLFQVEKKLARERAQAEQKAEEEQHAVAYDVFYEYAVHELHGAVQVVGVAGGDECRVALVRHGLREFYECIGDVIGEYEQQCGDGGVYHQHQRCYAYLQDEVRGPLGYSRAFH